MQLFNFVRLTVDEKKHLASEFLVDESQKLRVRVYLERAQ